MVHVLKRRVAYVAEEGAALVNVFPLTSAVPTRRGAGRVVWQISVNAAMANRFSMLQASTSCAAMVHVLKRRVAYVAEEGAGLVNVYPLTSVVPTRRGADRVVRQISVNAAMGNRYSTLQVSTSCAAMVHALKRRVAYVAEEGAGLVNVYPLTSVVPTRRGAGRVVRQISVNAAMGNRYSMLQV
jgi:hypothetical protein|uniref:Uncharacterized protein n=1 Tax=Phaeodactylum tricornutum TaxID=2850 RepID=A0A8J9S189_PHATR